MERGRSAAWAAWLVVAMLVASGPSWASDLPEGAQIPTAEQVPLGDIGMSVDEFNDLNRQSAAEQRRRLDIVLASHPEAVGARFLRLRAEDELADFAAVIADSGRVLADASLDGRLRKIVLVQRAEALIQARRFPEALAAANEAVTIDGSKPGALFARGWARYLDDDDQAESALADLDRGLQLQPDEGVAYGRRATIHRKQRRLDLAAKDIERAAQLTPDDAPIHLEYGVLLFQTHDLEHALAQFDIVARLSPGDPFPWAWRAQTDLALKRLDDAAADDRRADELGAAGQALADARRNVADILEDQQDFVGAAREYRRSLALRSNHSVATWLARTLWYSGQFAQAVDAFREHAASPMSDEYTPLWVFIMRGRADPADEAAAKAELAAHIPTHQSRVWTDTLVDLMLGRSTLDAALAEADAAETPKLRAGRRCEADYYFAEQLLMHAQDEPAGRLLEDAGRVCPSTYVEAKAIVGERRLLATKSPAR